MLTQQLELSPPFVLQLLEQVNAMQALLQPPGNNLVKQRRILKSLGDCGSCETPWSFQTNVNSNSSALVPPNTVLGDESMAAEGHCALH